MSDPIKDALRAACEAARKSLIKPPCCMEGTGCELPPCHCSRVAAAAAVAAYHRHMEAHYAFRAKVGIGTEEPVYLHRHLAAAVEKAARDE